MTRAYMSGFVGSAGTSNMIFAGNQLDFDYLAPVYHVRLIVTNRFFPPSSNRITLSYVFNWAASEVTQSGVPISAGVGIRFYAMTTEPTWRIQVLATLAVDETVRADLLPLANYWRPLY